MIRDAVSRLVRAWLITAIVDAVFSSALAVFAYRSTVTRLWQGVASILVGPAAFEGGARTTLVGLLLHCAVALGWSAVFLALYLSWPRLRRAVASPRGVLAVAALYGPAIWLVMSLGVISLLSGRPPAFVFRWWVQLVVHPACESRDLTGVSPARMKAARAAARFGNLCRLRGQRGQ